MNVRETDLKSLRVFWRLHRKRTQGLQMNVEILELASFALIAIALIRIALERRLDVLHGPYLSPESRPVMTRRWRSADIALDRLRSLEIMRQQQFV
jgi:hypothetical protein